MGTTRHAVLGNADPGFAPGAATPAKGPDFLASAADRYRGPRGVDVGTAMPGGRCFRAAEFDGGERAAAPGPRHTATGPRRWPPPAGRSSPGAILRAGTSTHGLRNLTAATAPRPRALSRPADTAIRSRASRHLWPLDRRRAPRGGAPRRALDFRRLPVAQSALGCRVGCARGRRPPPGDVSRPRNVQAAVVWCRPVRHGVRAFAGGKANPSC